MRPVHRYRAHGLSIDADMALPLAPRASGGEAPDLVLLTAPDREVPATDPPGRPVARLVDPDGTLRQALAIEGDRAVLRYPGLAEFTGDAHLARVAVRVHPGRDRALAGVLAAGALLAVHLRLRGEAVLHASAVRHRGRALAFVGASGMGKSTVAAVLCAHGAELVADDLLRPRLDGRRGVLVPPGSTETRLRTTARRVAEAAPPGAVTPTPDGRLGLRAPGLAGGPVPLAACIVPLPSRSADELALRTLPPARGLLRLLQFPRVLGWVDAEGTAREFQALADLADRVPVLEATIPWGLPLRPDVVAGLLDVAAGAAAQR